jgi:Ni2+-binding GTPase involved in maturation of urease and hydrogenase
MDLAEACEYDRETALCNIREIRPAIEIIELSAKRGFGMDKWLSFLEHKKRHD